MEVIQLNKQLLIEQIIDAYSIFMSFVFCVLSLGVSFFA